MNMKNKKKLIVILLGCFILSLFSSCKTNEKEDESDVMKNYCEDFTNNYEIEEKGDGTIKVKVVAPDFKSIAELILEKTNNTDFSVNDIKKTADENPELVKGYEFLVTREDKSEINKAFLDKVSEELIIEAIKNVEHTEEWSAGE